MADGAYSLPEVREVEAAYRTAHRALEAILPEKYVYISESELDAAEVFSQFTTIVDAAETVLAAHLGPQIDWQSEYQDAFDLTVSGIDFDDGAMNFGVTLGNSATEGILGDWCGSAIELAARVYRRECGWDHAPGPGGVWLLMLAPTSACGTDGEWTYQGYLAGFAIFHDRDNDGSYESLAHLWTARSWRRRGIAVTLLREASERFSFTTIERPLTESSAALLNRHPDFDCRR